MTFVSAKKVRESVNDKAEVFVMLASLEARGKGVVHDLPVVCEFPKVFPDDIHDFLLEHEVEVTIDSVPDTS